MVSDAASLGLALAAMWLAKRPRTAAHTYGYHRAEILAALANGVTLVIIAVFILREAWVRFHAPPVVNGTLMVVVATGGLLVNLAAVWILHGGRHESLNIRGAWLHVIADTLGSVQAIIAGVLIWAFGWSWVDPVASVVIGVLVVWSSWTLLRDSVNVLLEAAPGSLDTREIERALCASRGVVGVHDLHVWTITSGFVALSAHVEVGRDAPPNILWQLRQTLESQFGVQHSTLQLEGPGAPTLGDLPMLPAPPNEKRRGLHA
jgi:cobalt-zinc-cadmium efflux system protein